MTISYSIQKPLSQITGTEGLTTAMADEIKAGGARKKAAIDRLKIEIASIYQSQGHLVHSPDVSIKINKL